jgi:hypothetical protein
VWYRIVAPSSGLLVITNTGGGAAGFSISTGPDVAHQTYGPDAIDFGNDVRTSWATIQADVEAGQTANIAVQVDEDAGSPAPYALQWAFSPPSNDRLHDARVLSGTSGQVSGSTARATADRIYESPANGNAGAVSPLFGSKDVWFRWTAPSPGTLTVSTAGSSFDTHLHVGRIFPDLVDTLSVYAVADGGAGLQAVATLPVDRGGDDAWAWGYPEYYIGLSGNDRAGGSYQLRWTFTPAVPFTEVGDATGVPWRAQVPSGSGALTRINGSIREPNDDDMYRLCVSGTAPFSARASGAADLQLFLFDAAGHPLAANDDESTTSHAAALPAGTLGIQQRGTFYLAVSAYDNDPRTSNQNLFRNNKLGVLGPKPGWESATVIDWTGGGKGGTGSYQITLNGVTYCPA